MRRLPTGCARASLDEVVGQEHLTGPEGAIGRMVAAGKLSSLILWGPPGTGKTSIARLLADAVGLRFVALSAVFSGVADLKKVFAEARVAAKAGQRTLLFVDEIHRFNRAQQDGFLPYVEDGTVILVGATTENPSFELNAALLSRCQVLILHRLDHEALCKLLDRAEELVGPAAAAHPRSARRLGRQRRRRRPLRPQPGRDLVRRGSSTRRSTRPASPPSCSAGWRSTTRTARAITTSSRRCINRLRGSDPQAALYYLARMLTAGEEPLYVLRRLVRFASEDVGLADPQALVQCLAAKDSYDFLGSPEGELAIVQACLYLAVAPKSNAAYVAQKGGLAEREGDRIADAAGAHPQCPDEADEGHRLRQGLCL